MRHVTDGELHAYLDGALDLLPDDRGDEVRDHLTDCPVCRERLQDEETVRTGAQGILGDPELGDVTLPTFEELRERAEAPGLELDPSRDRPESRVHYRGPLKGLPLAWAATVVLALGVGWMGGEVFRILPSGIGSGGSASELVPAEGAARFEQAEDRSGDVETLQPAIQPTPDMNRTDLEAAGADRDEGSGARRGLPDPDTVGESAADALVSAQLQSRAPEPSEEARAARALPGADPVASVVVAGRRADLSLVGVTRAAQPQPTEALRLSAPGQVVDSVAFRPELEAMVADAPPIPDSLKTTLAVPGLEVLSVEWEESVPGERALHIRQLLPMGDTLELRYLGMLLGSAPASGNAAVSAPKAPEGRGDKPLSPQVLEASLPPGWNQVVMDWGRGVLVARGPLPEAQLRALVKTIH